ncbi:hypothetical protein QE521_10500, partial [Streptococcus suis]|uniref:hypothetical protein n=1 Tax=Streptococcus suis TaxID=1307 RepID=UPI0037579E5B
GTFFLYSKRLHNLYSGFTHYRNYRANIPVAFVYVYLYSPAIKSPENFIRYHLSMQSTETVYTVLALFAFLERKKKSPHRAIAPFQFLGHKLKRPVRV